MEDVKVLGISGGVWSLDAVDTRPDITASYWDIYEVLYAGQPEQTLHLVGVDSRFWEGVVSSAIQHVDYLNRIVTTSSGRRYLLGKTTGGNSDSQYVWNIWRRRNEATGEVLKTEEFLEKLAAPQS